MCIDRFESEFWRHIVGDPSWDWQSGKHFVKLEQSEFAIAPDPLPLSSFVRSRFEQLRSERSVWNEIREAWQASPPITELKLRVGPMASGSSVLADANVADKIVEQNRNLVGIEMEAYGVLAAAAASSHPRPTAFACKSVCDFANSDKNDQWQSYAAYTSAQAIRVFFETYMSDIFVLAGTK